MEQTKRFLRVSKYIQIWYLSPYSNYVSFRAAAATAFVQLLGLSLKFGLEPVCLSHKFLGRRSKGKEVQKKNFEGKIRENVSLVNLNLS